MHLELNRKDFILFWIFFDISKHFSQKLYVNTESTNVISRDHYFIF